MSRCHVALPTSLAAHGTGFTMTGSPQDLSATSAGSLGRAGRQVGLGVEVGDLIAGLWLAEVSQARHPEITTEDVCRLKVSSAICRTSSICGGRLTWLPLAALSWRCSPDVAT